MAGAGGQTTMIVSGAVTRTPPSTSTPHVALSGECCGADNRLPADCYRTPHTLCATPAWGSARLTSAVCSSRSTRRSPEHSGMGLPICRSIIEAHAGQLWATPNEPQAVYFSSLYLSVKRTSVSQRNRQR
jgi:hypothetical protein